MFMADIKFINSHRDRINYIIKYEYALWYFILIHLIEYNFS